jgi:hypothetical protein
MFLAIHLWNSWIQSPAWSFAVRKYILLQVL